MRLLAMLLVGVALLVSFSHLFRLFVGPFFFAMLLAYLSDPIFSKVESRGFSRSRAAALCLVATTFGAGLTLWLLLPLLIDQFKIFFEVMPQALTTLKSTWIPLLRQIIEKHLSKELILLPSDDQLTFFSLKDMSASDVLLSGLGAGTQLLWSTLLFLVATPTFSYFLIRDFKKIRSTAEGLIPVDLRQPIKAFANEVDVTVRSVLTGQIAVIGLLSLAYSTAFLVVGLPGGFAIGLLTGLARIVPYLDIIVGGSLSFLVLVTNGAPLPVVLGVVVSFVAIQLADGLFLTPRIVGQFAGLHPVVIVLAVLAFADRFGFFGILLAIPLTAVLRVALGHIVRSYRNSRFYLAL
jgi:predicted PurR-regulated permease PerM